MACTLHAPKQKGRTYSTLLKNLNNKWGREDSSSKTEWNGHSNSKKTMLGMVAGEVPLMHRSVREH